MPEQSTYLIPIWDTITTAWDKMYGSKGSIWAAGIIALLIAILCEIIYLSIHFILPVLSPIIYLITYFITILLFDGIFYIALCHVLSLPISYGMMFTVFNSPLIYRLIWLYILTVLILMIPAFIMIIGQVGFFAWSAPLTALICSLIFLVGLISFFFFYYRISLALPIVLDKQQTAGHAIKLSWQATRSNVLRLLAICIISSLILFVSMIPFGIGLIWTIPFMYNLYAVIYKRLSQNISFEEPATGISTTTA